MKPGNGGRIVALVHNGLGDVALSVPALVALDDLLTEDATILFVVKSALEEQLLKLVTWKHPTKFLQFNSHGRRFRAGVRVATHLRAHRPDTLVAFHANSSRQATALSAVIGAKWAVGPAGPWTRYVYDWTIDRKPRQHMTDYSLRFVEPFGPANSRKASISIDQIDMNAALLKMDSRASRWIILAPGSGELEKHKRWPAHRFKELIRGILSTHTDTAVCLLGSFAEADLLKEISAAQPTERVVTAIPSSVGESLALLQRAGCVVSGCTGTAHLGVLVGSPIVAIYGPTNPSITGPRSSNTYLVRKGYKCSPCYRAGFRTGCGNPICLGDIKASEVLGAIELALSGVRSGSWPDLATTCAVAPEMN